MAKKESTPNYVKIITRINTEDYDFLDSIKSKAGFKSKYAICQTLLNCFFNRVISKNDDPLLNRIFDYEAIRKPYPVTELGNPDTTKILGRLTLEQHNFIVEYYGISSYKILRSMIYNFIKLYKKRTSPHSGINVMSRNIDQCSIKQEIAEMFEEFYDYELYEFIKPQRACPGKSLNSFDTKTNQTEHISIDDLLQDENTITSNQAQ